MSSSLRPEAPAFTQSTKLCTSLLNSHAEEFVLSVRSSALSPLSTLAPSFHPESDTPAFIVVPGRVSDLLIALPRPMSSAKDDNHVTIMEQVLPSPHTSVQKELSLMSNSSHPEVPSIVPGGGIKLADEKSYAGCLSERPDLGEVTECICNDDLTSAAKIPDSLFKTSFASPKDKEQVLKQLEQLAQTGPRKYSDTIAQSSLEISRQIYEVEAYTGVHHVNWSGKAVGSKSATPPAVSLVVLLAKPKKEYAVLEMSPRISTLLHNAFTFVDPVKFTGNPEVIYRSTGSKLQENVTGTCQKMYSSFGDWSDDHYSDEEDRPVHDDMCDSLYYRSKHVILNGWHENNGVHTRESLMVDAKILAKQYSDLKRQSVQMIEGNQDDTRQLRALKRLHGKTPLSQVVNASEIDQMPIIASLTSCVFPMSQQHEPQLFTSTGKITGLTFQLESQSTAADFGEHNLTPSSEPSIFANLEDLYVAGESWSDEVGEENDAIGSRASMQSVAIDPPHRNLGGTFQLLCCDRRCEDSFTDNVLNSQSGENAPVTPIEAQFSLELSLPIRSKRSLSPPAASPEMPTTTGQLNRFAVPRFPLLEYVQSSKRPVRNIVSWPADRLPVQEVHNEYRNLAAIASSRKPKMERSGSCYIPSRDPVESRSPREVHNAIECSPIPFAFASALASGKAVANSSLGSELPEDLFLGCSDIALATKKEEQMLQQNPRCLLYANTSSIRSDLVLTDKQKGTCGYGSQMGVFQNSKIPPSFPEKTTSRVPAASKYSLVPDCLASQTTDEPHQLPDNEESMEEDDCDFASIFTIDSDDVSLYLAGRNSEDENTQPLQVRPFQARGVSDNELLRDTAKKSSFNALRGVAIPSVDLPSTIQDILDDRDSALDKPRPPLPLFKRTRASLRDSSLGRLQQKLQKRLSALSDPNTFRKGSTVKKALKSVKGILTKKINVLH